MAVGAKLHLSPAARRPTLPQLLAVALLCSASYLAGVWHHGGFTAAPAAGGGGASPSPVSIATAASVACVSPTTAGVARVGGAPLDFEAHHAADDTEAVNAAPARRAYEACPAKYSEYTPCEDVERSLRFPRDRLVYRERHCPAEGERLRCLVPAPKGYRTPFPWPTSRDVAWFANVPHKELTVEKAVQNWIHVDGDKFRFPGGGTMFPHGAGAYIDDIGKLIPLHDGSIRTALDTGCGVASWGAYLLSRNILAMSFAPRDSHEAQVQFALERGVPAMIGVLASNRLTYPARAFDMAHCSRCLIPWQLYDGLYLIEVDRILRPGGYWILSGPPINWKKHSKGWQRTREDLNAEQQAIESVAKSLCWKKIKEVGDIAIWQKPTKLWKKRVGHYKSVISQFGQKDRYGNLLDMNARFGGFAAALAGDPMWVMNMVPTVGNSTTLGVIYERGLIGNYQDWCEGMSTYPRTYDLIHADSVFSLYKDRCEMDTILLEMDRILRPEGTVIIRDDVDLLVKIKSVADGMRWNSQIVDHEDGPLVREKLLLVVKTYWTLGDEKQ
ncbi:unnamed protein product [Triticum turgidum subsp. durum]|uniref:Methyltransferase n=1 Tax=Triticum turgidum subsp. durum TaxID=4567 RepID=A0A9R1PVA1_TRITD|nr:unnamed protein product [Triticum turgidum subsp. durum]